MTAVITKPEFVTEEHLTYLDKLRESGDTNMFGAVPFIEAEFWRLTRDEAKELLTYWMKTFATRQTAKYLTLVRDRGSHAPGEDTR